MGRNGYGCEVAVDVADVAGYVVADVAQCMHLHLLSSCLSLRMIFSCE